MDKPISKPVESTGNKSDDVFTVIEQPNTKIDPSMYTDRKELSASEKDTVKEAYQKILSAGKKETDIQTVINGLDAKTLAGLRDILVKKIVILKKAGNTESGRFQSIAQMIVSRQSEMLSSSK